MIMRAKPWPSKLEVGQMMFGATGSYVGPGFQVSRDKLFDWNIGFGFKVIWR